MKDIVIKINKNRIYIEDEERDSYICFDYNKEYGWSIRGDTSRILSLNKDIMLILVRFIVNKLEGVNNE